MAAREKRFSRERQVRPYVLEICFGDKCSFTEVSLTLTILLLKNVALTLFPPQYFAGTSHFKTFSDGFPGFGFSCSASHGARRLSADSGISRDFTVFCRFKRDCPPSGSKVLSGKWTEESLSPLWLEDFASDLAVFVDLKIMKGPFGSASRRVLQIGLQLGREHFEDGG